MNKIPGISSLLYSYLNEPVEIIYPSIILESIYGQIYDNNDTDNKPINSEVQSNLFSNPIDLTLVVESISPILITIVPDYGSTIGGTTVVIYGVSFERYKSAICLFGNTSVAALILNGTAVECITPSMSFNGTVQVDLTFDGVDKSTDLIFTYVNQAVLTDISPNYGSTYGGTELNIRGLGFYENNVILCNFGYIGSYSAIFVSDTELVCITPSYYIGGPVLVTLSGTLSFYMHMYICTYTYVFMYVCNIYRNIYK
jgi:hypothetical protein